MPSCLLNDIKETAFHISAWLGEICDLLCIWNSVGDLLLLDYSKIVSLTKISYFDDKLSMSDERRTSH